MSILGKIGNQVGAAGRSISGVAKGTGQMVHAISKGDTDRFREGLQKTLEFSVDPISKAAGFHQPILDLIQGKTGGGSSPISGTPSETFQQALQNLNTAGGPGALPAFSVPGLGTLPTITAATVDPVQQVQLGGPSQFAGGQQALISALQQQAAGQGPSVAEALLRQQQDKMLNQQAALAASMSGRALPAAQRQIMQQQAAGSQDLAQQAAIMKAQEQLAAQQQLAGALGTFRGQDIQRSGLGLQAAQANQEAALRQALANQQAQQEAMLASAGQQFQAQQFGATQELERQAREEQRRQADAALQAQKAQAQLEAQTALEQSRLAAESQRAAAKEQAKAGMLGGLLQGGAAIGAAALSDKRAKNNIKDFTEKDLNEFFKAVKPKTYRYNNEKWGQGDRVGFLIQDIEKTKIGKSLVKPHETGMKGFDPLNLQGILLSKLAFDAKKSKKAKD